MRQAYWLNNAFVVHLWNQNPLSLAVGLIVLLQTQGQQKNTA
jgi:hypothetical protein